MTRLAKLFSLLSLPLFAASSCAADSASFSPTLLIDQALVGQFNQIEFWIYENIDTKDNPLLCSDFMKTGTETLMSPGDSSKYNVVFSSKFAFNLDRENTKEFTNIPAGNNYIIYVRGYQVEAGNQKFLKAHGCKYNTAIEANSVNELTIKLENVSTSN